MVISMIQHSGFDNGRHIYASEEKRNATALEYRVSKGPPKPTPLQKNSPDLVHYFLKRAHFHHFFFFFIFHNLIFEGQGAPPPSGGP